MRLEKEYPEIVSNGVIANKPELVKITGWRSPNRQAAVFWTITWVQWVTMQPRQSYALHCNPNAIGVGLYQYALYITGQIYSYKMLYRWRSNNDFLQ